MHHLGGIKDSKRIVSATSTPRCRSSQFDEAFVADLREVLPLLVERIRPSPEVPHEKQL